MGTQQPRSATSSSTMGCVGCTAVSGRPSSAIFRRGPSTSPCMTGSRPASANCPWASMRPRSQSQNGSILRPPRRATSPSCASTRGPSTSSPPWSPVRPAPSAPIRSGLSRRASWCAVFFFLPPFLLCHVCHTHSHPLFVSQLVIISYFAGPIAIRRNHVTRRDIVTRSMPPSPSTAARASAPFTAGCCPASWASPTSPCSFRSTRGSRSSRVRTPLLSARDEIDRLRIHPPLSRTT